MTCFELYNVWLFKKSADTRLVIWESKTVSCIYDIKIKSYEKSFTDKIINDLSSTTVKSFYTYRNNEKEDVLVIRISKIGE